MVSAVATIVRPLGKLPRIIPARPCCAWSSAGLLFPRVSDWFARFASLDEQTAEYAGSGVPSLHSGHFGQPRGVKTDSLLDRRDVLASPKHASHIRMAACTIR